MGLFDDLIPASSGAGIAAPIPVAGRKLLDAIAGSESPSYNTMYGGGQFESFSDHPRIPVPIQSGPNAGRTSSAAGRYQFLGPTWDEVKKEANLPDFSPDSQDRGAWFLAQKVYNQKTGRDLAGDLEGANGNPQAIAMVGKVLSGTWTSLPGGAEPNSQTGSFVSRFAADQPTQPVRRGGLFDDLVPVTSPQATSPPDTAAMPDTGGRFSDTAGENFRTAREGQSPPVATRAEAFGKGAMRGVTFNWIDELNGLARAGGLSPEDIANTSQPDPAKAVSALVKGAYRLASGDPDALAAYKAETSAQRSEADRMREQQPAASVAGELGGALATVPFTGGTGAATLPGRAAQGARAGAVYGGVAGAGEGTDLQSRATGGLVGAGVGGAIGTVAPVAVEGALQGARLAATPFRGAAQMVRGAIDPEAEAARRVVSGLQRDAQVAGGPAGLTPQEFTASVNSGGPAALMDLGGETTRALARSAANTSPEGRAALNTAINDRFESQSGRVTDWLNRTFGPSDTGATREALQDAARQANKPAYAKAYREGDQPLWSPELQRIVGSPDVVDAMRAAAEKGKSRAVVDGFGGFNSSVQISPTGVVEFTRGKNGQPTYPNLQFWDYTKRALDDAANAARRAGRNDEASVLGNLSTKLRGELDTLVPSYQNARAGAARFFGAGDALEAGEKFLTGNMPMPDARRAFAALSPAERDLFREGFVQSLTSKIEATGDRRNVLNSIAQSPRAQQQIELAMGPQRAREFEAMMRTEGVMDLARGAVQGNSTTARQLTELGLAGGVGGLASMGDLTNPSALMTAALTYGALRGKGAIDQRVARKVAEMLTSNDPGVLRKGINIVGRNQNMLNAMRSFDLGASRAGTQQASGVLPAIQGPVATRADQDQQQ